MRNSQKHSKGKHPGEGRRERLRSFSPSCAGGLAVTAGVIFLLSLTVIAGLAAEDAKSPASQETPASVAQTAAVTSAAKAPSQQPPGGIPVAEVTARATEISSFLTSLYNQFSPNEEIGKIRRELPDTDSNLASGLRRTMSILREQPTLEMLQAEQQGWQQSQAEIAGWIRLLTQRATALQAAVGKLEGLQKSWQQTIDTARANNAPETIIEQITGLLDDIETAKLTLQTDSSALLDLQGRVAVQAARCGTALSEISRAQQTAVGRIASREKLPIWSPTLWRQVGAGQGYRLNEVIAAPWKEIQHYLKDPLRGMPFHLGLFGVILILFLLMGRSTRRWPADELSAAVAVVTEYPWTAAIIISVLLATAPVFPAPAPPTVRNMLSVVAVAAMVRLVRPVVEPQMVPGLYAIGFLFALDTTRHALGMATLFDQVMVVLEAFAGMAVLTLWMARSRPKDTVTRPAGMPRIDAHMAAAILTLAILGAGLIAGILGYMRVARLLVSGVFIGAALALTLISMVKILSGVVAFLFRVRPMRLLRMVDHHRDLLEHRTRRVFAWIAVITWFIRVLDYVGMFQPALSIGKVILAAKLQRGTISLSLADVLAFVITIWAAFLISAFIRFVLQEDVYPRRKVPEGFAYAASRLLHYFILTVGFVMGLGLLGVDLTKVTVLLGAFGVGIGFGLQGVVNNFVSGLILLFERPIHLGDTVEMGSLLGKVRRIGIRASIVRTLQGSEIIVPNSQLISEQVTNWTFSDQMRRIDLPVGVNYGAAPRQVIAVIESAAASNPRVMNHPRPEVLFTGFGDSSLDFELRAWTDRFEDWLQIRSELGVTLYDALQEAGIAIPFPQREVRLLQDTPE